MSLTHEDAKPRSKCAIPRAQLHDLVVQPLLGCRITALHRLVDAHADECFLAGHTLRVARRGPRVRERSQAPGCQSLGILDAMRDCALGRQQRLKRLIAGLQRLSPERRVLVVELPDVGRPG